MNAHTRPAVDTPVASDIWGGQRGQIKTLCVRWGAYNSVDLWGIFQMWLMFRRWLCGPEVPRGCLLSRVWYSFKSKNTINNHSRNSTRSWCWLWMCWKKGIVGKFSRSVFAFILTHSAMVNKKNLYFIFTLRNLPLLKWGPLLWCKRINTEAKNYV